MSHLMTTILIGLAGTSTAVWAAGKTPEVSVQLEEETILIKEKNNEAIRLVEEIAEVEAISEAEATKEQI